jgi:hypothetical protein
MKGNLLCQVEAKLGNANRLALPSQREMPTPVASPVTGIHQLIDDTFTFTKCQFLVSTSAKVSVILPLLMRSQILFPCGHLLPPMVPP